MLHVEVRPRRLGVAPGEGGRHEGGRCERHDAGARAAALPHQREGERVARQARLLAVDYSVLSLLFWRPWCYSHVSVLQLVRGCRRKLLERHGQCNLDRAESCVEGGAF